jgi:hypothetical protein
MVHGRKEAGLAEGVGPGAVVLPGERVVEAGERQILERGCGLGIEDVHQCGIGQVR